ncbi:MAG: DUF1294 domain-containing protein [Lachnospiraceae bacterium]|nr:DUF1294 domain-containing protein [Lachnospiraceae bacterium]
MSIEQILFIYFSIINVIAFIMYGIDKALAKAQKYRISEASLLFVAFLGGSAGALCGMFLFHHKTRKLVFLICVPLFLILQTCVMIWFFFYSNIKISILY